MAVQGNKLKNSDSKKSRKPGMIRRTYDKCLRFVRDERVRKITGLVLLLAGLYMLIAFTSFLFTWKADQDKVAGGWSDLSGDITEPVNNRIGKFGAVLSYVFIHRWFGIASFYFVFISILLGVRALFHVSLLPLRRSLLYGLFGLFWFSITLGCIFQSQYLF